MSLYGEKKAPADEAPTAQIAAVPADSGRPGPTRAVPRQVPRGPSPSDAPTDPAGLAAMPRRPATSASSTPSPFGQRPSGSSPFTPSPSAQPPSAPTFASPAGFGQGAGPGSVHGPGGSSASGTYGSAAGGQSTTYGSAADAPTATFGVVSGGSSTGDGSRPGGGGPPKGEPLGPPTGGGRRRGARRMILAGGIAVALVAVGGGTAGYAYAGEVPRGTTVLGLDLGGKTRAEATSALHAEMARRGETFSNPVQVRIGDRSGEVVPADVGLTVDVDATVAASAASDPTPIGRLFGSHTVEPVVTVDPERLDAALRGIIGKDGKKMTMPAITFDGTTRKPTYPKPGIDLVAEQSAQAVRDNWLTGEPVEVPLAETHPVTTAEEVDRLVAELAKPAVAAPVTVTTDRGEFTVPTTAIAKSLILKADKTGKIEPKVDDKKLRAALADQLPRVEVKPKEATMSIAGGTPKVIASSGGQQVDTAALGRDLLGVLPKADGRGVKGTMKAIAPKTTTEDLAGLGIKEQISTFTTDFTGGLSDPRSQNIVLAAKEVDGTLVKPGETFSLNGHTGERGYAQGYKDAPVILDGKLVPGVGGGISQFTTTLFNATYYAGLEDVEHKPHSYYFSRYPAVIESTIFYPNLDFKFRNNTSHGVLLDTSWTSSSITVSVWSTKIWEKVSTEWGPRRDTTNPKLVRLDPGPDCIATSGIPGFSQDAFRIFRKDGKEVKREKFSWTYQAEPRFVCAKKP